MRMSDEETVTEINAETVIEYINSAVEDVKETEDYLSYLTLLDIHLSDPSKFTDEEKLSIIKALTAVLTENQDIVLEIGWDLPELLLRFFDLDWDFSTSLRSCSNISTNMAIFDVLARKGNAKELFLKSIELLNDLDYEDLSSGDAKKEKIVDIKFHVLLELLSASLKRIITIYPSKFLAMALSALLKTFISYSGRTDSVKFIVRKVYSFVRDYIPPQRPVDYIKEHGLTQEEADKLEDDENYLQRTLMRSFSTNLIGFSFRDQFPNMSTELFVSLKSNFTGKLPTFFEQSSAEEGDSSMSSTKGLYGRIVSLMMSQDFVFEDEFKTIKSDSLELFKGIESSEVNEDVMQKVLQLTLASRISQLYNPESERIPLNVTGLLFAITAYTKQSSHTLPITIAESIALAIRFLSPGIISESFRNAGLVDSVIVWSWVAIVKAKLADFQIVPKYQIVLYLQILLFYASILPNADNRYVIITLLTRVLTMIDESTAYDFIINTLTTAPYQNAKAAMVLILKDLTIRERPSVNDITDKLASASISEQDTSKSQPPKLPSRKYIELTPSRVDDLYILTQENIAESFSGSGSISNVDIFKTLLNYMNFLISNKQKFKEEDIKTIVKSCEQKVQAYHSLEGNNHLNDIQQGANVDLLTLALEPLK